jgi:hypothetical protein
VSGSLLTLGGPSPGDLISRLPRAQDSEKAHGTGQMTVERSVIAFLRSRTPLDLTRFGGGGQRFGWDIAMPAKSSFKGGGQRDLASLHLSIERCSQT